MATVGSYSHKDLYFDCSNFASWKHKMHMHILGHNPSIWATVFVGMQGDPEADVGEQIKRIQVNAQA
jgi:hypothetical protein